MKKHSGVREMQKFFANFKDSLEAKQGGFRLMVASDIEQLMVKKGVNKTELAKRMNTSQANVTMLLSGDRNLTLDTLCEIYWHLGERPIVAVAPQKKRKGHADPILHQEGGQITFGAKAHTLEA